MKRPNPVSTALLIGVMLPLLSLALSACEDENLTAPEACRQGCQLTCEKHDTCQTLNPGTTVEECYDECEPHCSLAEWSCPEEPRTTDECHGAIRNMTCDEFEDYVNQTLIPEPCQSPCVD